MPARDLSELSVQRQMKPNGSLTKRVQEIILGSSPRADRSGNWRPTLFRLWAEGMNAEFIAMLDYLERERGIKRDILLEAVSNALLSASKKSVGASRDLRIDINPKSGEIRALANLVVVEQVT